MELTKISSNMSSTLFIEKSDPNQFASFSLTFRHAKLGFVCLMFGFSCKFFFLFIMCGLFYLPKVDRKNKFYWPYLCWWVLLLAHKVYWVHCLKKYDLNTHFNRIPINNSMVVIIQFCHFPKKNRNYSDSMRKIIPDFILLDHLMHFKEGSLIFDF